ncbi:hypothetical protein ACHAXT_000333 [Thalassiosira profunda]
MVQMKAHTIAIQIALFGYSAGADVAFVPHAKRHHVARKHAVHRRPLRERRPRENAAFPLTLDASAGSSSTSDVVEMPPVARRRHPLFRETNAVSKQMPVPHPELWRRSLPEAAPLETNDDFWGFLSPPTKHVHVGQATLNDVHVEFDDPEEGARQLLEQCGVIAGTSAENGGSSPDALPLPEVAMAEAESTRHLADVLSYFQSVAAPPDNPNVECIARVVSTRGSIGTKCPRWHADHVPVRLVMSILGPGCECIPETFDGAERPSIVNRRALNSLDEDDTAKANDVIVPPRPHAEERIKHARTGEAVLLMGRGWEDAAAALPTEETSVSGRTDQVLAAVHRSPVLSPGQERILLTVDLVDW